MQIDVLRDVVVEAGGAMRIAPSTMVVGSNAPAFTLVIKPEFLKNLTQLRTAGDAAKAFVMGNIDIEGDMIAAIRVREKLAGILQIDRMLDTRHTPEDDAANIAYHYDLSNDFYRLFLDSRMMYSCGYFGPHGAGEGIERAQEHKLQIICGKLALKQGLRVLDIGCGWGGLGAWMAKHHKVRVDGVTLSDAQLSVAKNLASDMYSNPSFRKQDYRHVEGESVYDRIVSVGMAEHVGNENLGTEFFPTVARLLKPDGWYLHHVISRNDGFVLDGGMQWLQERIFPGSELTTPGRTIRSAEQSGLCVRHYADWGMQYARTLRCWYDRLTSNAEKAALLTSEETVRLYRFYLASCSESFESGRTTLSQILFSKNCPERPEMSVFQEMGWMV